MMNTELCICWGRKEIRAGLAGPRRRERERERLLILLWYQRDSIYVCTERMKIIYPPFARFMRAHISLPVSLHLSTTLPFTPVSISARPLGR